MPSFAPGNAGLQLLCTTAPLTIGNATRAGELQFDGFVLHLSDPHYSWRVSNSDQESTANLGYWPRVEGFLTRNLTIGAVSDCRITDALMDELAEGGETAVQNLAHRFAAIRNKGIPLPLFSFATSLTGKRESALRDAIRKECSGVLIGRVFPDATADYGGWDFIVVRPESAPPAYQGQAALGYFASVAGSVPVFFRISRPDFYEETFWYAAGVAGFYFDDLPAPDSPEYASAWGAIRSFNSFRGRFGGKPVRVMCELESVSIPGAVGADGNSLALILTRGAKTAFTLPATPAKTEFVGMWYNPLTDQNIIQPRTGIPPSGQLQLDTPSPDPWIYSAIFLPASTDADTSTPRVEGPVPRKVETPGPGNDHKKALN